LIDKSTALPFSQVVKAALTDTGYLQMLEAENTPASESRLMNLEELVNAAVEWRRTGRQAFAIFWITPR